MIINMNPIITQFKATDNPYSVVVVLYIVNDSFTLFVDGKITGNSDANEDVIPPTINKLEHIKECTSFVNFFLRNKPTIPVM